MEKQKLHIIYFHGLPCAGKDTQAEILLSKSEKPVKISTGEIFRGAIKQTGKHAKYYPYIEEDIENVFKGGLIENHIHLKIDGETAIKRSVKRMNDTEKSGLDIRKEDRDFGKRLVEFKEKTLPMIEKLEKEGRLITIDGAQKIEKVTQEINIHLEGFKPGKERLF